MAITAKDVQTLREMTGVGMMDCKKALTEAEGNMDKAVEILREKGLAASQKKAGRIAAEGMAYATVVNGVGVVVEVNAETDFVGKNVPSSHEENVRLYLEEVDGRTTVEITNVEQGARVGSAPLGGE